MAESENVVLKISFEGQLRRTHLTPPVSILEVREQISRLFPSVKYFTLSYMDEEGDKITVSTDLELQEAHRVCHPNIRLLLEKQDQATPSSFEAHPADSLLDYVSPAVSSPPAEPSIPSSNLPSAPPESVSPSAPSPFASILAPVGSLLNYISPNIGEEDVEFQKQLEEIYLQEKEEKERREREEREIIELVEKERREREEQERIEREEKERRERERIELEEKQRREREERERIEREEKERREKEEKDRAENLLREQEKRLEQEKHALNQQQNDREKNRQRVLETYPQCGEILEKLLGEGVELELVWQALEFSGYFNEKKARDLLQMNELGLDFRAASEALDKHRGKVDEAIDSLMG